MTGLRLPDSTHWRHWLMMADDRSITGCHCGFMADEEGDCGYGDSVLKHIVAADRAAIVAKLNTMRAEAETREGHQGFAAGLDAAAEIIEELA